MDANIKCKNCGSIVSQPFCGQCGQSASVKRINFSYIVDEIQNSVFQVNKGFFFSVKELSLRPSQTIRDFLAGKRQNHFKPIAFFVVATTIYLITRYFSQSDLLTIIFLNGLEEGLLYEDEFPSITKFFELLTGNIVYSILLSLPVTAFATYLAFLKWHYNYYEHLAINLYITGYQMLIYACCSLFTFVESVLAIIPSTLTVLFNVWVFVTLYENKSRLQAFALTVLSYLILAILVVVLVFSFSMLLFSLDSV